MYVPVESDVSSFVAWWGAVLSTIVFGWDIYKYVHAGPKIHFTVLTSMQTIDMPAYEGKTVIMAKATNRGDRPTTNTNWGYLYFRHRPFMRNRIPDKAAVITIQAGGQPLPFELKPGGQWVGLTVQTSEVEEWATHGTLYMVLSHSHSEKPLRQRVTIRIAHAHTKKLVS